ncbi:putative Heparan sulfate 2-O-sulfotransferase 1, partial [Hypsibius exemplaris]
MGRNCRRFPSLISCFSCRNSGVCVAYLGNTTIQCSVKVLPKRTNNPNQNRGISKIDLSVSEMSYSKFQPSRQSLWTLRKQLRQHIKASIFWSKCVDDEALCISRGKALLLLLICGVGVFVIFGLCTYLNGIGLESLIVKNDTCPRSDDRCSAAFRGPSSSLNAASPRPGRRPSPGCVRPLQPEQIQRPHLNTSKNRPRSSAADQCASLKTSPAGRRSTRLSSTATWPGSTDGVGVPTTPVYINIVRDPIDRLVSYYYFLRYGDDFRRICRGGGRATAKSMEKCGDRACHFSRPRRRLLGATRQPLGPGAGPRTLANKYFARGCHRRDGDFVAPLEATLAMFRRCVRPHTSTGRSLHLRKTFNKTTPLPATTEALRRSPIYKAEAVIYQFAFRSVS